MAVSPEMGPAPRDAGAIVARRLRQRGGLPGDPGPPGAVPAPHHRYLLGSPMQASRLAQRLQDHRVYRATTGDCGQLLASQSRMDEIGAVTVATTCVVDTRGNALTAGSFGGEPNDGVVALSEVSAGWVGEQICAPVLHSWLSSSRRGSGMLLRELPRQGDWPTAAPATGSASVGVDALPYQSAESRMPSMRRR